MGTRMLNNIIMFMLISSTGGLLFVFNRNQAFAALFFLVMFSLFYIGKRVKKTIYYSLLLSLLVVLLLFAINFLFAINPQSLTKYSFFGISIFITVLVLFYYSYQDDKKCLIESLYFVLKLILFHSLFSFLVYFFVKEKLILVSSAYHDILTYNYLFFYSPKEANFATIFGLEINRNAGIFWEAGILQAYLNILFFLEMSIFKRNKYLLTLIILAIISTYSTTGLLLIIIQLLYFSQIALRRNIALGLISLIGIPLFFLFSANISDKIYGVGESSFQKRLLDLTQPFFIALDYPINGVGLDLDRFQEVREEFYISSNINSVLNQVGLEQKVETTSKGSTNSIMYLLAGMGFPTTILFIYMLTKQQIIRNHRFIWLIIIFVSVMSEPLLFRPFFFMFIISGFMHFFYKIINHKKQLA